MNNEKFKLTLSAPIDKNGLVIKLTVDEGLHTLHIKHYPEFTWYVFGLLLSLPIIFVLALLIDWGILFYSAILFGFILYNIFYERAFVCVINSNIGMINYHRSGILMSPLDEQKGRYNITSVKQLEMLQHYRRGGDTFQIYLRLNDGQRIQLSPSNLSFSECQTYAKKICEFLGSEIPIKAVG